MPKGILLARGLFEVTTPRARLDTPEVFPPASLAQPLGCNPGVGMVFGVENGLQRRDVKMCG